MIRAWSLVVQGGPATIPVAAMLMVVLGAFSAAWATGRVFYEVDTVKQYAPFLEYAAASLRGGTLPLWNPYLGTGFPFFAEGQTGVLHPINLPFLMAGAVDALLVWGPVLRALLAALAAYLLARALGVSPASSAVSGLAYGLGSFVVAQQHHVNHGNTAPALPLCLAGFEMAMRAQTCRRRVGWLLATALAFTTALLATHPQLTLIVAVGLLLYVGGSLALSRWTPRMDGWRGRIRTGAWALGGGVGIAVVAGGLGAIQMVPLVELIGESGRADAIDATEATKFAIPPLGLVQLIFPGVFGGPEEYWFSGNAWETAIYLGLVPLVLALLALRRPCRTTVLFAVLALAATLYAQGSQSPIPIWDAVSGLPGFDRARAPGRFSMLSVLALAIMAGIGLDAVRRRTPSWSAAALGSVVVAALIGLGAVHAWSDANPEALERWLASQPDLPGRSYYLTERVVASTAPARPLNLLPTACAIAFLAVAVAAARRPSLRQVLAPAAFCLSAAELGLFAATFHPLAKPDVLLDPPAYAGAPRTYPRVFISEAVDFGSNRLLPARQAEATIYTPLALRRVEVLREAWYDAPTRIARILGVDQVVYLSDPVRGFESDQARRASVTYSLGRPTLVVDVHATLSERSVELPAVASARELHLVLSMDGGLDASQGETVATVTWLAAGREVAVAPLRAGIEVAERTGFGALRHRQPAHESSLVNVDVSVPDSIYSLVQIEAPPGALPDTVVISPQSPGVLIRVHGMSIVDLAGNAHRFWSPPLENVTDVEPLLVGLLTPPPRVELVRRVQLAEDPEAALKYVLPGHPAALGRPIVEAGPWGPSLAAELLAEDEPSPGANGDVRVTREEADRLEFEINAGTPSMLIVRDAFYPGWKAAVDGEPAPVLPANLVQRAIPVPAGAQRVELWYDPASFRLGAAVSTVAALCTVVGALALWQWPRLAALPTRGQRTGPRSRTHRPHEV